MVERAAQMFPKLTADQIRRISAVGRRKVVRAGELKDLQVTVGDAGK